jgi:UDP-N-acetylglucosamine transferase subunit ALG13
VTLRVLVAVGTDRHKFNRLIDWIDRWAQNHPDADVVVQHGSTRAPNHAVGYPLLSHEKLRELMAESDVVVTHGGPATITEARRAGRLPLAVARDPRFDEHVDDHQQHFVAFLAARGLIEEARDEATFAAALDRAARDPRCFRLEAKVNASDAADKQINGLPVGVQRAGEVVAHLVAAHRRGRGPSKDAAPASVAEQANSLTVLYIGGQGRSGSTLIERALGELPGTVNVGEVLHLWRRGLLNDELCGCGAAFHSCPFWTEVGADAFGGWDQLDAEQMVALRYQVDRNRYVPLMLRPGLSPSYDRARRRYTDLLSRLYRAIVTVSGASVVVDSSKHASYALLLRDVPGIDLRLLHVVRDSPAVAHAWSKQVERPETDGVLMPTYGPVEAAMLWTTQNIALDLLGRSHAHATIRYEDFVATPSRELAKVRGLLAGTDADAPLEFLDGKTLHLHGTHSVAGNPMRFQTGAIDIRADESWREHLPPGRRRLVSTLTAPGRLRYGYLRRPS